MRKICSTSLALVAPLALLTGASGGAQGASRWAPESTAKITPGVQMYTDAAQCTANFVYGVLSNRSVGLGTTPVTNTIGNLYKEMAFARRHSGIGGLHLVKGTRGFSTG